MTSLLNTPARGTTLQYQLRPPHQPREYGVGQGDPELTPVLSKPVNRIGQEGLAEPTIPPLTEDTGGARTPAANISTKHIPWSS